MKPRRSAKRAVTLIETMAVIVLLALATAVLARGVTAGSPERELQRSLHAVSDLDSSARSMARTTGSLRVMTAGGKVIAIASDDEIVIQRSLSSGFTLEASYWSSRDWLYIINPAGRSEDAGLVLTGPNEHHKIRIDGLLGRVRLGEHQ